MNVVCAWGRHEECPGSLHPEYTDDGGPCPCTCHGQEPGGSR